MSLTVLNDWHIGAVRSAGTTPATAYQLRLDLLRQFEDILAAIDTDLMILGDLFNGPDISKFDLLRTYHCLNDWLTRTNKKLYLVNGNHDLSKNSTNFSSFQFLAQLLVDGWRGGERGDWVTHVTEGAMTPHGYVIPHVVNQEQFNVELSRVPECGYLFVHCNYDNGFAVDSDHSLNMSEDQAKEVPVQHIVFAHEHQGKAALGGKVVIMGNQFPSSVSDCLGNQDKSVLSILEDGGYMQQTCWQAEGDFSEQDWRDLTDTGRFIRVVGTAEQSEAAAVVTAISRFRQTAKALVITNAVKIAGVDDADQLQLSHEEITSFNVREALRELLTDDENNKIDNLMKEEQHAQ